MHICWHLFAVEYTVNTDVVSKYEVLEITEWLSGLMFSSFPSGVILVLKILIIHTHALVHTNLGTLQTNVNCAAP